VLKPWPLKPGDLVSVVAPSGPFDRESFERGLAVLSSRYRPAYSEGLFSREGYLAGNDARRLEELNSALADENVRAIFCARGGYGALRLLRGIDLQGVRPKPLVGFSDGTALHGLFQSRRRVSIHGPVLTQLGNQPAASVERFFRLLESPEPADSLTGATCLVPGIAQGPLVGGNLAVFSRLLGTPYLPDLRGAVLLLEDVTERPYRLDRMWQHLALAGVFQNIAGIVLGQFLQCDEKDGSLRAEDTLRELAQATQLPCATGFAIGHGEVNMAVPLGCRVRLEADRGRLLFLESACQESSS
jgi:muramoyltetrapeptide carboxypeptidase